MFLYVVKKQIYRLYIEPIQNNNMLTNKHIKAALYLVDYQNSQDTKL